MQNADCMEHSPTMPVKQLVWKVACTIMTLLFVGIRKSYTDSTCSGMDIRWLVVLYLPP